MIACKILIDINSYNLDTLAPNLGAIGDAYFAFDRNIIYFKSIEDDVDKKELIKKLNKSTDIKNNFCIIEYKDLKDIDDLEASKWFQEYFSVLLDKTITGNYQRELKQMQQKIKEYDDQLNEYIALAQEKARQNNKEEEQHD